MAGSSGNAAVIGGGLGGIAAAIRLAAAGRRVTLFEQSETLGGKANTTTINGYRFDTGPSLLTLPEVFDDLFQSAGRERRDYIEFIPLSPLTGYFFDDGSRIRSDFIEPFTDTLYEEMGIPKNQTRDFFAYARRIYNIAGKVFLNNSLHELSTYRSREVLSSLMKIWKIDPLRTMHQGISSFFSDPRIVQLFCRYGTYNGSDPYQAPGTMNNIAFVEHGLGGYAVSGGIYAIVTGMERLAQELGVVIRTGCRVERILLKDRRVCGVTAGGENHLAEVVISNSDVLPLYETLLKDPSAPLARRYRKLAPSTSGIVFYWGMDRNFDEMGVHSIFFSSDYPKEFHEIHQKKQIPEDPTVYVNITSKVTPSDAPPGGENWFVLINAPVHDGRDWNTEIPRLRDKVIGRVSAALGRDISGSIRCEGTLTPADIELNTGSSRGSLYGISSNSRSAAFLRHPNRSRRFPGLYLCGGSVHPGGGMPLAVLSGKIVSDLVQTYDPA